MAKVEAGKSIDISIQSKSYNMSSLMTQLWQNSSQWEETWIQPWSRKIPHAVKQLSPLNPATESELPGAHEPQLLKLCLCSTM